MRAVEWSPAQTRSDPRPQEVQPAKELETICEPSLGDVARKLKADRAKGELQPVKVFTNDNLPTGPGGVSIVGQGGPAAAELPAEVGPGNPSGSRGQPASKHSEAYYRKAAEALRSKLDLQQRELWVLQQKLNLAEPQYYADPNKALREQYSRAEINKLNQEIEGKKAQIADDQKALEDLRVQLQREGGDIGWLRPGPRPLTSGTAATEEQYQQPAGAETKAGRNTKQYWQARFKSARERLKNAQEEQQLAEDELSLLETRQANESSEDVQNALATQIPAKQAEVEIKRAATAKAQAALDALEQEFKQSGAPEEWSQTD